MPKKPHHLRSLPDAVAGALTPEAKRGLADLRTGQQRRRRARDAGGWAADPDGVPPYLAAPDAEAPGAADLWRRLPIPGPGGGFDALEIENAGRACGLSPEATVLALDALRRSELVGLSPAGGTVALPPGDVRRL